MHLFHSPESRREKLETEHKQENTEKEDQDYGLTNKEIW